MNDTLYSICSILLVTGMLGLAAQALLGGTHSGHGGARAGGHGHAGGHAHVGGHGHSGGHHAHTASGTHTAHGAGHQGSGRDFAPLLALLSPLTVFSLFVGIGATGLLLKPLHLAVSLVALAAALGGLIFYGLLVRPIWSLVFKFASKPSLALEGTVAEEAEALTHFDPSGRGLVRLTIDGQLVRILATLEADDRAQSQEVQPGEKLIVTRVDGHTNSCRVARL